MHAPARFALAALFSILPGIGQADVSEQSLMLQKSYGKLPMRFEINQGQMAESVKFLARGKGYAVYLTPTEAVLSLVQTEQGAAPSITQDPKLRANQAPPTNPKMAVVKMGLVQANAQPKMMGVEELITKSNYFTGKDPKNWHTNVANYGKVKYNEVYPGIDLVYYGTEGGLLEHDFIVAPGADPAKIKMTFSGTKEIKLDPDGNLILAVDGGEVIQEAPLVYQEKDGQRETLPGKFTLNNGQVGFKVAAYDHSRPLVIDPVLAYSTYLGGSAREYGNDIAIDDACRQCLCGGYDRVS